MNFKQFKQKKICQNNECHKEFEYQYDGETPKYCPDCEIEYYENYIKERQNGIQNAKRM